MKTFFVKVRCDICGSSKDYESKMENFLTPELFLPKVFPNVLQVCDVCENKVAEFVKEEKRVYREKNK